MYLMATEVFETHNSILNMQVKFVLSIYKII